MRRLIALVSCLVALDLAMLFAIVPLLPLFAREYGFSTLQSGLLVAAYSASVVVLAVPVGHLADRIGARSVTVAGSLLMALATATFAVGDSFAVLFLARLGQGAASSVAWGPALAWLAERAPARRRGSAIGIANAAATAGVIVGPVLGGVVAATLGVRTTFLAAAAASLALAAWASREPAVQTSAHRQTGLLPALRTAARERVIAISMLVIALVAIVGGTLQTLLPLRLGEGDVSQSAIGWLYTGGAVLGAVAITTTGRVGDRTGRLPIALCACLLLAGGTGVLALPLAVGGVAAMLIVLAPVQATLYGVGYPLGADGADRAGLGHGLVMGLVNLVWGVGAVVGPIAGAAVSDSLGSAVAYMLLAALCLAAAIVIRGSLRVRPQPAAAPASGSPPGR